MAPEIPERYTTTGARMSLARRFGLPYDPVSQDWEWEVADPSRFEEYLEAYVSGTLDEDERFSLMEMLIQCVENLNLRPVESSPQWHSVASLLLAQAGLHASSIRSWSCLDDRDLEDCFRVSEPMRAIWQVIRQADAQPRDTTDHG